MHNYQLQGRKHGRGEAMPYWDENDDDDGGLPDAAFTELELAAGVQHIMRTGDPNATRSNSGRTSPHGRSRHRLGSSWGKLTYDFPVPDRMPYSAAPESAKVPYPKNNPASASWVRGSYPTNDFERELSSIDIENARNHFWPALKKLAPYLYERARRDYQWVDLPEEISSAFVARQTRHELFELLNLLEHHLEGIEQWYASKNKAEDDFNARVKRGSEQDRRTEWQKSRDASMRGNRPDDLVFWRHSVEAVMDELVDRE
jgi:hypothetical protein